MSGYLFEYKVKITKGTRQKTVTVRGKNCKDAAQALLKLHKPSAIHSAKLVESGYNKARTVTSELRLEWQKIGGGQ